MHMPRPSDAQLVILNPVRSVPGPTEPLGVRNACNENFLAKGPQR
jgi:hypothetical protein